MDNPVVSGWLFEPVMSEAQKTARENEQQEEQQFIEKRSGPPSEWCHCGKCIQMEDPLDNVCCHDDETVLNWVLGEKDCECITNHHGFPTTILNIYVLNMVRHDLLRFVKDKEKRSNLKLNTNKTHRYLAYRNFVSWINSGEQMGKNNRVRIPSCTLSEIRQKWPETEGNYIGFKQAIPDFDFE